MNKYIHSSLFLHSCCLHFMSSLWVTKEKHNAGTWHMCVHIAAFLVVGTCVFEGLYVYSFLWVSDRGFQVCCAEMVFQRPWAIGSCYCWTFSTSKGKVSWNAWEMWRSCYLTRLHTNHRQANYIIERWAEKNGAWLSKIQKLHFFG